MVNRFGRFMLAGSAALLGVAVSAQQPSTAIQAQVDRIFGRYSQTTPGCVVGADVKGEPVVRAAYGMADLEHDVPMTVDTILETGSVAKQFTAAAVLLLARDGKLSLDDPLGKYLPELGPPTGGVTIRQTLQHTAGIRDWGYLVNMSGAPRGSRNYTNEDVLEILSRQKALDFSPGTNWSYSTSGYNLAAILVSRVSGMSFAQFTKTRIFDPLGMRDSSWRDDWTRIVKRRGIGYSERQGTFAIDMPFENAHGNGAMLTTVGDLLKWNANLDKPIVGDAAFVTDLQRRAVLNDGRSHEYALGLYVDTFRGVREIDHSGGIMGYQAHLGRYPDQQVSVAVMCNVGGANPTSYAKAVAELFLTGLRVAPSPQATHTLTPAEAARLAGLYRSTHPVGIATIVYNNDALLVQNVARLVPTSATRFVTSDLLTYEFDGRGQMRRTDEFGTVVTYDRVEPARPTMDQLKAFAGRYVNDEVETTLNVTVDGETLVIHRRPNLTTPLTPVYADAFRGNLDWVVFRRDASGRIAGLSVSQDRMWDLPFTREP